MVVGPEVAVVLGVQHADVAQRRVEDVARPADRQPAARGLAAAVHVAVFDAPPLVGVAPLADDLSGVVHLGGAQELGDVERQREKIDADRILLFELERLFLGQVGVGAFVIEIVGDGANGHARGSPCVVWIRCRIAGRT